MLSMNERQVIKAVRLAKGAVRLAALCGVTPTNVYQWQTGRRPVPVERCARLESACGQKVMRWHLRPDDWHLIWPELVAHPMAPKPKA